MRAIIIWFITIFSAYSCHSQEEGVLLPSVVKKPDIVDSVQVSTNYIMKITINNKVFSATLVNNATSKTLRTILPVILSMNDLNNHEKYGYLPTSLPTSAFKPAMIESGDIMLFGSNTLVIFYKTFSTSYSYTRIGKIDRPVDLQSALGTGSVSIKFEFTNQ